MSAVMTKMLLTSGAATTGNKAAVAIPDVTPFLTGREALVRFVAHGQVGTAPVWAVDGSVDNVTWDAAIATSVVASGEEVNTVVVYPWMRVAIPTQAGTTPGTLSVILEPLK